jgi:hypothetical protein
MKLKVVGPIECPPRLLLARVHQGGTQIGRQQAVRFRGATRRLYASSCSSPANITSSIPALPAVILTIDKNHGHDSSDADALAESKGVCLNQLGTIHTGVYFNDSELARPLHPLQFYGLSQQHKLLPAMTSKPMAGRPLRAPPPLAKQLVKRSLKLQRRNKRKMLPPLQDRRIKSLTLDSSKTQVTVSEQQRAQWEHHVLSPDEKLFLEAATTLVTQSDCHPHVVVEEQH